MTLQDRLRVMLGEMTSCQRELQIDARNLARENKEGFHVSSDVIDFNISKILEHLEQISIRIRNIAEMLP